MKLVTDIAELRIPCPHTVGGFVLNRKVLLEMFSLMWEHKGAGLAAPQVGIRQRFFITAWDEVFINPLVVPRRKAGKMVGPEGCLSLPGQTFMVERWREVGVAGTLYTGGRALVIQHELDHLDGLLINERGKPI